MLSKVFHMEGKVNSDFVCLWRGLYMKVYIRGYMKTLSKFQICFPRKIYAWQTLFLFCHISNPISSFPLLFLWRLFKTLEIHSDHTTKSLNIQIGIRILTVLMWGILRMLTLAITIYLLLTFLLKILLLICALNLACMHICVLHVCLLTTEARQVISISWFWVSDSCELQQPWCENWILDPLAEQLLSLCFSPLVNNSC